MRLSTLKFKFKWIFFSFSDSSNCVKRHELETLIVGASLHFKQKYRNLLVSTGNILWRSTAYTFKFTCDSLKVNFKKLLCGCRCIIQLIKENREEISEHYNKIQRKIVKLNFHGRHWSTSSIKRASFVQGTVSFGISFTADGSVYPVYHAKRVQLFVLNVIN